MVCYRDENIGVTNIKSKPHIICTPFNVCSCAVPCRNLLCIKNNFFRRSFNILAQVNYKINCSANIFAIKVSNDAVYILYAFFEFDKIQFNSNLVLIEPSSIQNEINVYISPVCFTLYGLCDHVNQTKLIYEIETRFYT